MTEKIIEPKKEENNFFDSNKELILLGLVGLIVFAGALFLFNEYSKSNCTQDLDGLKVLSCDPAKDFGAILSQDEEYDFTQYNSSKFKGVIVELNLVAENSSVNSVVGAVGAEVVSALAQNGRNASAIGVIDGKVFGFDNVPEEKSQELVGKTSFVVRLGECDCLKIVENKIIFEGDKDFMLQHLLKLRGIIGLVLAK